MTKTLFISLAVFMLTLACSTAEKTYTVEEIDGVRYIHNIAPLWGDNRKISLEYVRTIGGEEETNEDYMFFKPRGIVHDNEGNIFVLDSGNYRIKKYDRNWNFITAFGREGQGPGELTRMAYPLLISSTNRLYVFNTMDNRLQIFGNSGEVIRSLNFNQADHFVSGRLLDSDEIVMVRTPEFGDKEKSSRQKLLSIMDSDGNYVREFGEFEHYDDPLLKAWSNRAMIDVAPDNTIVANFLCHNRIDKYSSEGKLLVRFDRPLNYDVTNSMKRSMKSGRERTKPDLTIVSFIVAVDGDGRIWIDTVKEKMNVPDRKAERLFHIFSPEGILLQEIPVPGPVGFCRIFGNTMYLFNEHGVSISEYRIITDQ